MRTRIAALFVAAAVIAGSPAYADPASQNDAAEDTKARARAKYLDGVALVKSAHWSDALAAFEAAAKIYPDASTTFNMGACERALGHYVRARATLKRAIAESEASATPLPDSSITEAKGFIAEIDRV